MGQFINTGPDEGWCWKPRIPKKVKSEDQACELGTSYGAQKCWQCSWFHCYDKDKPES